MDLKESDILGADIGDHWYYRSKAKAMMRLLGTSLPTKILDVGAGSGFFSSYLLANTPATEAWCVDISYDEDWDSMEAGKPVHYRRSIVQADADIVLLMDVLEHVDDDVALLKTYVPKVPVGTRFLISVPAFRFLWSGHDVFLDHRRRYTLSSLEDVVRNAGLVVRHGTYYFGAVFPIAATIRLAGKWFGSGNSPVRSQLTRHHPAVNNTLAALCAAELPLLPRNRLAGLTVFCVAETL